MKQKRYYGWICMVVAALAMVGTLPGRTQGLGLVTAPMLADLHLDELRFSGINLVATLLGALFALPAGWLVDRAGVRTSVTAFSAALGLTVLALVGVHGVVGLAIALTLTRGLGQTALSIASLGTIGKWFARRLSMAMGIYSLVLGIGFCVAFPGVQAAAEHFGWRAAFRGVGLALLGLAVVSAALLRRSPAPDEPEMQADRSTDVRRSLGLVEALCTPAFWVWGLTCALYLLVASGTSLFTELMLRERGLGASTFRAALATTALVGILANFVGGFLGQRIRLSRLLAVSTLLLVPCLAGFPLVHTQAHALVWAAGLGAAGGIVTIVFFTIWAEHFGRAHLGVIQGVAQALTVLASALGPVVFATSVAQTGRSDAAFLALAPVFVVAGLACFFVRPPARA